MCKYNVNSLFISKNALRAFQIDHAALDEQIQQKMNRDAEEKNRDAIFDEHARQFALMAKDLEEKAALVSFYLRLNA